VFTVFTHVLAAAQFSDRSYTKKISWNIISGVEIMNYEYNFFKMMCEAISNISRTPFFLLEF
jgi:hypothetical protein